MYMCMQPYYYSNSIYTNCIPLSTDGRSAQRINLFAEKKIQIAVFLKVCPRTIMGGYVAYDITMQITGQVD